MHRANPVHRRFSRISSAQHRLQRRLVHALSPCLLLRSSLLRSSLLGSPPVSGGRTLPSIPPSIPRQPLRLNLAPSLLRLRRPRIRLNPSRVPVPMCRTPNLLCAGAWQQHAVVPIGCSSARRHRHHPRPGINPPQRRRKRRTPPHLHRAFTHDHQRRSRFTRTHNLRQLANRISRAARPEQLKPRITPQHRIQRRSPYQHHAQRAIVLPVTSPTLSTTSTC